MSAFVVGATVLNAQVLERKIESAFRKWVTEDINGNGGYFAGQFRTSKWNYPGVTNRKSGPPPVGSPRDIYDLGKLYESGNQSFAVNVTLKGPVASWNWDATNDSGRAYAWYVHEGLSTNLEPRQWTDVFQSATLFSASPLKTELLLRIKQEPTK